MFKKHTPLDNLKTGLILEGKYKLVERIPRWVGSRRFLAQMPQERVQVLFFEPASAPLPMPEEWLEEIKHPDSLWLPVLWSGEGAGLTYLALPEVRGPSLREMIHDGPGIRGEEIASFMRQLAQGIRPLAERGWSLPPMSMETILVRSPGRAMSPALFPLPLVKHPAVLPEDALESLRGLLFSILTKRKGEAPYRDKDLRLLPRFARHAWAHVFEEELCWDVLEDLDLPIAGKSSKPFPILEDARDEPAHLPSTVISRQAARPATVAQERVPLPPRRNLPERRGEDGPAASRLARNSSSGTVLAPVVPPPGWSSRPGKKRRFSLFDSLTIFLAVAAVSMMGWFAWKLVHSLLHSEAKWGHQQDAIMSSPANVSVDAITPAIVSVTPATHSEIGTELPETDEPFSDLADTVKSLPQDSEAAAHTSEALPAALVTPAAPATPASPLSSVSLSLSSAPPALSPQSSSPSISNVSNTSPPSAASWPKDTPGKIGSALLEWASLLEQNKEDAAAAKGFEKYLSDLTSQVDALRGGRLPEVLQNLETVAAKGFPAARYFLAQVLWGRDSRRSEEIMVQLALEDYGPARVWCSDRDIAWR